MPTQLSLWASDSLCPWDLVVVMRSRLSLAPISAYYALSRNLELAYSVLRRRTPPGGSVCMVHIVKDAVRISSIPSIAYSSGTGADPVMRLSIQLLLPSFLPHCVFLSPSIIHSRKTKFTNSSETSPFLLSRAHPTLLRDCGKIRIYSFGGQLSCWNSL
jgi:hypothetical protein